MTFAPVGTGRAFEDVARRAALFDVPLIPFVARFIGGHNVVPGAGGMVAIRADRCRLGAAGSGPYLSGRVSAVEYQGPLVRVALETEFARQATALLPDKQFYSSPVEPGERATLV